MKGKLLSFGVALLAMATIGAVQLQTQAAEPGQVGNAPRCSVNVVGERSSAFNINGNNATVRFKVTGSNNCKVQLSANSFYAPSMDGRPYDKQILFEKNTKIYTPGNYSLSVGLPQRSTPAKGCFYQVDLTYGGSSVNVRPVLAFGHGKVNCDIPQPPKPVAECKGLTQEKLSDNRYRYQATAAVSGGATVRSYSFVATKNGQRADSQTVTTNRLTAGYTFNATAPGTYQVRVTVNTSEGAKSGANCVKTFTVPQPTKPAVMVEKYVDTNKKYKRVGVNVEYSYRIVVKNTGNTDLKNVKVTDTPQEGVTLISVNPPRGTVTERSWTYTIPTLMKGESQTYTLKAKVPVYLAGMLKNTVCVDAPEIPGNPDDCDEVTVDVPQPGKVLVCNPATDETIEVDEKDAGNYVPVNSPECEEQPVAETPEQLPETGMTETILSVIGAMSLAGSGAYYIASRRNI